MECTIRTATREDASVLSDFAAAVFTETFAADNDPADLAAYLAEAFRPDVQAAEIADPAGVVLLAEAPGRAGADGLAGYAHLVASDAPAAVVGPAPIELKRLYVHRDWHGRGVAAALLRAAISEAGRRGAGTVWLGVWEKNRRAIAFYAKHGFVRVGEHTFQLGRDPQTDWIMAVEVGEGG